MTIPSASDSESDYTDSGSDASEFDPLSSTTPTKWESIEEFGRDAFADNTWESIFEAKNISVKRAALSTSSYPAFPVLYKAEGVLPFSAQTLYKTMTDSQYRLQWDPYLTELKTIARRNQTEYMYVLMDLPKPAARRDYVMERRVTFDTATGTYVIYTMSGAHKKFPPLDDVLRIDASWCVMEILSRGNTECAFTLKYVEQHDGVLPPNASASVSKYLSKLTSALKDYPSFAKKNSTPRTSVPVITISSSPKRASVNDLRLSGTFGPQRSGESIVDDLQVTFDSDPLGLQLEPGFHNDTVVIGAITRGSQAAKLRPRMKETSQFISKLEKGLILSSVNGSSVRNLDYKRSVATVHTAVRPVTLGFDFPRSQRKVDYDETKQMVTFIIRPYMPLSLSLESGPSGYGAFAAAEAKPKGQESPQKLNGREQNKKQSPLEADQTFSLSKLQTPHVEPGFELYQINDTPVSNLKLRKILHLLVPSSTAKKLYFRKPLEQSPSRKRSFFRRLSLSKIGRTSSATDLRPASPGTGRPSLHENAVALQEKLAPQKDAGDLVFLPPSAEKEKAAAAHTDSWEKALDLVLMLADEERYVAAAAQLDRVEKFVKDQPDHPEVQTVRSRMADPRTKEKIDLLRSREKAINEALLDFNSEDAGWIFGHKFLGITTFYKPAFPRMSQNVPNPITIAPHYPLSLGENDTLWVKLEGTAEDADLFNCLAVVRETDKFNLWAPFCNRSYMIKRLGRCEILTYFNVSVPMAIQRDAVVHAFAADTSYEHRCLLILGGSVDSFPGANIPPIEGWNSNRMLIKGFRALVEPTSRTSGRLCIVANFDPRIRLPQKLLNFAIKKMAGVLLYLLQEQAKKIAKDDKNPYAVAIREDKDGFYSWLRPKIEEYFSLMESDSLPPRFKLPQGDKEQRNRDNEASTRKSTSSGQRSHRSSLLTPEQSDPYRYSESIWSSGFWLLAAVFIHRSGEWEVDYSYRSLVSVSVLLWLFGLRAGSLSQQSRRFCVQRNRKDPRLSPTKRSQSNSRREVLSHLLVPEQQAKSSFLSEMLWMMVTITMFQGFLILISASSAASQVLDIYMKELQVPDVPLYDLRQLQRWSSCFAFGYVLFIWCKKARQSQL